MTHDELLNNSSDSGTKVPMTHDELLDAIDRQIIIAPPFALGGYTVFLRALRAVVELHKPWDRGFDWLDKEWCSVCLENVGEYMNAVETKYPCPTIQAIEKELA